MAKLSRIVKAVSALNDGASGSRLLNQKTLRAQLRSGSREAAAQPFRTAAVREARGIRSDLRALQAQREAAEAEFRTLMSGRLSSAEKYRIRQLKQEADERFVRAEEGLRARLLEVDGLRLESRVARDLERRPGTALRQAEGRLSQPLDLDEAATGVANDAAAAAEGAKARAAATAAAMDTADRAEAEALEAIAKAAEEAATKAAAEEAARAPKSLRDQIRGFRRDHPVQALGAGALGFGGAFVVPGAIEGVLERREGASDANRDSILARIERQKLEQMRTVAAVQRLQASGRQNLNILAVQQPHVFNELVAGRRLSPGVVSLGGDRTARMERMAGAAMMMSTGDIQGMAQPNALQELNYLMGG